MRPESGQGGFLALKELEIFREEFVRLSLEMRQVLRDALDPVCEDHGISQQQAFLLLELCASPGRSMGEVSDDLGILRTNFTQLVRKLEDGGLVVRTQSPSDKRTFMLDLTDEGRAVVLSMQADFERRNAYVRELLSPQVGEDLNRGMEAIREIVAAMKAQRIPERK